MLIYITGTEFQKVIENAIYEIQLENNLPIGDPIKSNSINLLQTVKSTLCKNKEISTILVDLSVVVDDDYDIEKAFKTLRHFNNDCRFIIIATERAIGDELLSKLVDMGIYNIITDEDELLTKIPYFAIKDATYKEASLYQIDELEELEPDTNKKSKRKKTRSEKLEKKAKESGTKVILNPLKGKVIVSIIGTQPRVGVTHSTISLAFSIMKKGNRVAVIENNSNGHFHTLIDGYENEKLSNDFTRYFKIYKIDFFPDVDSETLDRIKGLNYDYILIDNGEFATCDLSEHNRSDVKLVVFGSTAWEQRYLENILKEPPEILNSYRFLTLCDEKLREDISEALSPCKVYFHNYKAEPFTEDSNLLGAMEGYLYEEAAPKKKGLLSFLK